MEKKEILSRIKEMDTCFNRSNKTSIVSISTTANINNPSIYFGSMRETEATLAGNIIISDSKYLSTIVGFFDGKVDCFLVDAEEKNNLKGLFEKIEKLVVYSKIHCYKPNDITVEAVDEFIACKYKNLKNKNILILGAGNIGSKTALTLSERGAFVWLYGPDFSKTAKIIEGLNYIKRGSGNIFHHESVLEISIKYDIIIGCSPGIPVIDKFHVKHMKYNGLIIDVGNGTIYPETIEYANNKGIDLFCASVMPGYVGYIERWLNTEHLLSSMGRCKIKEGISLISVGLIGAYGEVLVRDLNNKDSIIGVCDGKGDILCHQKAKFYINKVKGNDNK